MRRMAMAMGLGLVAMLGGSAVAKAYDAPVVRSHRLDRWGFDARGPSESMMAYRDCPRERLVTVNSRRTAGDWATAVLTAGWYTPAHVTVQCAPVR